MGNSARDAAGTEVRTMSTIKAYCFLALLSVIVGGALAHGEEPFPEKGPRTFVLAGEREAFRDFCLKGPSKDFFAQLKREFDAEWLKASPPAEPEDFGDPSPKKRTSEKVDKWREAQCRCNQVAGTAEAATVIWLVTGEPIYLQKAKEFLLAGCSWNEKGATLITYNDEAHFRLWRKLPFVYDQIRDQLSEAEKKKVLDSFRKRGNDSFALIKSKTEKSLRNSLDAEADSHPIRFLAMTGLSGLALWDDLPEAHQWLEYALTFYENQFPTWGGDDGGWGEGNAYWRGNVEHSRFEDALVALNNPQAYSNPFWRQTGYFPLYFVQPYRHTTFGDTPNAGKFNLEPMVAYFDERLARQFQDGYLLAYSQLENKAARSLESQGLYYRQEMYPAGMEFLLRDFAARKQALPAVKNLSELPPGRWFRDVGWVSMHSALGKPEDDIMLSFKSSPYASFSHSHADQNAFILNAYGENLIINAGYREYHRSPHHKGYTETTLSKNTLLVDGQGQKPQSREATGKILFYETGPRTLWTAGDATVAYNTLQPDACVVEARRDVVMVDQRYFIMRDRVKLKSAKPITWQIHAESPIKWEEKSGTGVITQPKATCDVALLTDGGPWKAEMTDQFPIPVDPKYRAKCPNQFHLQVASPTPATEYLLYSVYWPTRAGEKHEPLQATRLDASTVQIQRPDGKWDRIQWEGDKMQLQSPL